MAASVRIEFDDGSRIMTQTLGQDAGNLGKDNLDGGRPLSCSIADFFEINRTVAFIRRGKFAKVALQFPDPLLPDAAQVLWTVETRLRKLKEEGELGMTEGEMPQDPLIFITGDTSYGSCCVDEVAAQHLKADAIVHYGRACLSPTNASVPVLYVFGQGRIDVSSLAQALLAGPLCPDSSGDAPPVLLLYDVIYAHALPRLLEELPPESVAKGRLVVGWPKPEGCAFPGMPPNGGVSSCDHTTEAQKETGYRQRKAEDESGSCCHESSSSGCNRDREGVGKHQGSSCDQQSISGERAEDRCDGYSNTSLMKQQSSLETGVNAGIKNIDMGQHDSAGLTATLGDSLGANRCDGSPRPSPQDSEGDSEAPNVRRTTSGGCMRDGSDGPIKGIRIGGLEVALQSQEELEKHTLVFVGGEGRQLSNVLLRCNSCQGRASYDPAKPLEERSLRDAGKGNRDLMRRYYLVQKAKEASVIGIVVGTLGVRRYSEVVRSVRHMIEAAGRKAYTLAVGKINVAKLANFAEVEVFCLVACAENSLLDSKEFHAPVITPLELEVALGRREWTGFYSTEFEDVLALQEEQASADVSPVDAPLPKESRRHASTGIDCGADTSDEDEPYFSLVSGTYKSKPRVLNGAEGMSVGDTGNVRDVGEGALIERGPRTLTTWASPAADFLQSREYRGLEAQIGQTEAKAATEGQFGIASDYGGI